MIVIAFSALALEADLRLAVPLLVGVTAAVSLLLAFLLFWGERGRISWSPFFILSVALLLRLLFLFSPPQLSDDIYRYLWDGSQLLKGGNPYRAAPSTVTPPPELSVVHSRINHPEYVTIYPPAAQLLFAGGATLGSVTGLKGFLVLIDLGLCGILLMVLKRLDIPAWRAVLYAWNPLPVLEIAGSGHVDGAGLTLFLGAVLLLVTQGQPSSGANCRRWPVILSGALSAATCLVKLFPLVLMPVLFLLVPAGRRRYLAAGFLITLAALLVPFLPHLVNMTTTLEAYARHWEFAGFAFTTLRAATGSGTVARMLLSGSFLVAGSVITLRVAGRCHRAVTPTDRAGHVLQGCYAIAMALLLVTPTLHPWYALCLAVFLPFSPGPAGLVLCWAVFLAYQVQTSYFILGQWTENPYVTAAVFMAPVVASGACKATISALNLSNAESARQSCAPPKTPVS